MTHQPRSTHAASPTARPDRPETNQPDRQHQRRGSRFRSARGKAIPAWGDGTAALDAAGIALDAPGVLIAGSVDESFIDALAAAVGLHRVWERAVDVMASEVAPVR
jgi:long catalase-like protein